MPEVVGAVATRRIQMVMGVPVAAVTVVMVLLVQTHKRILAVVAVAAVVVYRVRATTGALEAPGSSLSSILYKLMDRWFIINNGMC